MPMPPHARSSSSVFMASSMVDALLRPGEVLVELALEHAVAGLVEAGLAHLARDGRRRLVLRVHHRAVLRRGGGELLLARRLARPTGDRHEVTCVGFGGLGLAWHARRSTTIGPSRPAPGGRPQQKTASKSIPPLP